MFHFSIHDLENLSGIKAHTIRIWEQRYSFLKPARSNTNIRYYSNEELKTLLDVSLLNKYGFKVSYIDQMSEEKVEENINKFKKSQAEDDYIIHRLILSMAKLDMHWFADILDNYENGYGINTTVTNIIYPFMQKIAFLNNKFEHLVSGIVRLKLIAAIEQLKITEEKHVTVLAFLPEGNYAEVELLYAQFLFKQKLNVIYLGANVPVKDVIHVASYKNPQFIYTHISSNTFSFNADKFLSGLSRLPENIIIIISGDKLRSYKKNIPPAIRLVNSIHEAAEFFA